MFLMFQKLLSLFQNYAMKIISTLVIILSIAMLFKVLANRRIQSLLGGTCLGFGRSTWERTDLDDAYAFSSIRSWPFCWRGFYRDKQSGWNSLIYSRAAAKGDSSGR